MGAYHQFFQGSKHTVWGLAGQGYCLRVGNWYCSHDLSPSKYPSGEEKEVPSALRIDTPIEVVIMQAFYCPP